MNHNTQRWHLQRMQENYIQQRTKLWWSLKTSVQQIKCPPQVTNLWLISKVHFRNTKTTKPNIALWLTQVGQHRRMLVSFTRTISKSQSDLLMKLVIGKNIGISVTMLKPPLRKQRRTMFHLQSFMNMDWKTSTWMTWKFLKLARLYFRMKNQCLQLPIYPF